MRWTVLAALLASMSQASGQPAPTPAELIARAYADAFFCKKEINIEVARPYVRSQVRVANAADIMLMVVEAEMLLQKLDRGQLESHCADAIRAFGADGTAIRGVLLDCMLC